jgi:glutamate-5-semialdehyde dehydrogenase
VQLVEKQDRTLVDRLLLDTKNLDLVIPRGGEGLIRAVVEKSRIPVIKHYKGVCHVYVDASAKAAMAASIAVNAKAQRPGTCNSAETLLLDQALKPAASLAVIHALDAAGVKLYGDASARKLSPLIKKGAADIYDTEWLDLIMNVGIVDGVNGAVSHIARHGTGHTETIVAEKPKAQKTFMDGVDSSAVMVNASTRLADGGQFGLGAEVGTSTDKLHARGPMGIESLTTYRWVAIGNGQIRE